MQRDRISEAHHAAEMRLQDCWAALLDNDQLAEARLSAPYCGCDTCVVREVLDAAYPHLRQHFTEEAA